MSLPKYLLKKLNELIEQKNKLSEDDFVKNVVSIAHINTEKPRTIINRLSLAKKHIKAEGLAERVVARIKPEKELIDMVINEDQKSRASKENFVITLDIVDKLQNMKEASRMGKIAFCILVSGRRVNEILNPQFKITKARNSDDQVRFSGLSKQKSSKSAVVRLLPFGTNSKEFVRKVKAVRNSVKGESIPDIRRKLNKWLRKNVYSGISSHSLRGIYGHMMWLIVDKRKTNINGYLSSVLNHDSFDTSLNYSKYVISNDLIKKYS
jgi:integrase